MALGRTMAWVGSHNPRTSKLGVYVLDIFFSDEGHVSSHSNHSPRFRGYSRLPLGLVRGRCTSPFEEVWVLSWDGPS